MVHLVPIALFVAAGLAAADAHDWRADFSCNVWSCVESNNKKLGPTPYSLSVQPRHLYRWLTH